MKITALHPASRALAGASVLVFAGASFPVRAAAADEAAMHDELRQLKTVYEEAINSGNLAALEPLFESGSSGVVVDNQPFKSPAELKSIYDRFHAAFPGVVYRVKLNPEPSLIFGNLAVAHGTGEEYVKTAAGEFTYASSFTVVLRRDAPHQWKLVRSQITMDPFQNSIVQYFVAKTRLWFGGGALAAGLLGGVILGRLSVAKKGAAA